MYDISVISGIPASVVDLLPLEPLPTRLHPLFSVGVHDMDLLASGAHDTSASENAEVSDDPGYGWIACTTDDILSVKENLYDTLVTMPHPHSAQAVEKVWPRITLNRNTEIKATQRDYRRYKTLQRDLRRYPGKSRTQTPRASSHGPEPPTANEDGLGSFNDAASTADDRLIESQAWSALAYSSFMWWASAGEQRSDLDEEMDHDSALLSDFHREYSEGYMDSPNRRRSADNGMAKSPGTLGDGRDEGMGKEMALIAYFHRLTALIFRVLADIVDATDASTTTEQDGTEPGEEGEDEALLDEKSAVYVGAEDVARMGLDVWSQADRKFIQELIALYWGRKADVQGARVECCGVRLL